MNKTVWGIVVLVIVITGVYLYLSSAPASRPADNYQSGQSTAPSPNQSAAPSSDQPVSPPSNQAPAPAANEPAASKSATLKEFTVAGRSFSFTPNTITVDKGNRVKIIFKDDDGFHDLRINGYGVGTERVNTGGESIVEFTADKTGTFEYYCSVDGHRERGMVGTLVVK